MDFDLTDDQLALRDGACELLDGLASPALVRAHTDRGDAFVDFSPELSTGHPGGSFSELLTVYAIVHAVTSNLPAVQRVQILLDGKEVDTIAGHVDVRRPLAPDTSFLRGTEAR